MRKRVAFYCASHIWNWKAHYHGMDLIRLSVGMNFCHCKSGSPREAESDGETASRSLPQAFPTTGGLCSEVHGSKGTFSFNSKQYNSRSIFIGCLDSITCATQHLSANNSPKEQAASRLHLPEVRTLKINWLGPSMMSPLGRHINQILLSANYRVVQMLWLQSVSPPW